MIGNKVETEISSPSVRPDPLRHCSGQALTWLRVIGKKVSLPSVRPERERSGVEGYKKNHFLFLRQKPFIACQPCLINVSFFLRDQPY
ncbi:MAG: hypothetical protein Q8Q25_01245, partial [bacterium]|nr:hypothetical protein [bacterium]